MLLMMWLTIGDIGASWNDVAVAVLKSDARASDFEEASAQTRAAHHWVAAAKRGIHPKILALECSRDHRVWVELAGGDVFEIVALHEQGAQWMATLRNPVTPDHLTELSWNAFAWDVRATLVTR